MQRIYTELLEELEIHNLKIRNQYFEQKISKRKEATFFAIGMLILLFILEIYMLSGLWSCFNATLPDMAITLLSTIPLVAMTTIVVIIILGAFGKEPSLSAGNLVAQASEASQGP
ncbi:MAG: hypothetical protein F4044_01595 [Rhodobacteraceae bacterium]|nr:hypothetical protein [Paracoccaceae bacterium]